MNLVNYLNTNLVFSLVRTLPYQSHVKAILTRGAKKDTIITKSYLL